jgi:alpha-tubulin suppressor-like RCC1 family protein
MRLVQYRALLCALATISCSSGDDLDGPPVAAALRFVDISAGYYHTCGLAVGGAVYCWGNNAFGTLGDGTRTTRTTPARIANGLTYSSIDAGAGHNCALAPNGVAECWGQNDEGQVGDGSFIPRDRPVPVTGNLTFRSVTAGHAHSCGVTTAGVAYCWGDNSARQLGAGEEAPAKTASPLRVQTAATFAQVIAGYYQTCALTAAGEAYCWGLGGGAVPAHVETARTFTWLSPGDRFVCGISNNATHCWGTNRHGEIANGQSARKVFASAGESTLDAQSYACSIDSDNRAACWGGAVRSLRAAGAAQPLDSGLRFSAIATGASHICALTTAGYAYCGGANYTGQLGDGTHTDRSQLVPVTAP